MRSQTAKATAGTTARARKAISMKNREPRHDGQAEPNALQVEPQLNPEPTATQPKCADLAGGVATDRDLFLSLAHIAPKSTEWLWPNYIPCGALTSLDGDPGLGKSTLALDLAARVSRGGPMPDGQTGTPGRVLLLSAEDDLARTVLPRFVAAGGDLDNAFVLDIAANGVEGERLTVPDSVGVLRRKIERHGVTFVVIDPLVAFFSPGIDAHKDQSVRAALAPLAAVAEDTRATILMVRHLAKATGRTAIYRGGGSIGIIGAARAGYIVTKDPDDEGQRVFAQVKSNLGPSMPSLSFRVASDPSPRIEWQGVSDYSADELVVHADRRGEEVGRHDRFAFLLSALVNFVEASGGTWEGSAADLVQAARLDITAGSLGKLLTSRRDDLRALGIQVERPERTSDKRTIRLRRVRIRVSGSAVHPSAEDEAK